MDNPKNVLSDICRYPLVNYNFLLRVDAVYDLQCRKIGSITQEKEYEMIQEGGVNDYVHMREKPISKPFTFQVERYIGENFFDPLPLGKRLELPVTLYVGRYLPASKNPRWTFTFQGCTVTNKTYGELDAERSGLMVETTTIAYQQMELEQSERDPIYSEGGMGSDFL